MFGVIPGSRYANITIILSLFFAIASLRVRKLPYIYLAHTDKTYGAFTSEEKAKALTKDGSHDIQRFRVNIIEYVDQKPEGE
jgi:hypothetical protein